MESKEDILLHSTEIDQNLFSLNHSHRKHYYNFRYLTNMLKKRSRGFDRAHTVMLIKFSKQIGNSFVEITNC